MNHPHRNKIDVPELARNVRHRILDMAFQAGASSAHIGGALSIVDITATLFGAIMTIDPINAEWPDRDRFILSKGHGCLAYYAVLAEIGYLSSDETKEFEKTGSTLLGHPVMNRKKGIEFSTGSLGMGLSLGIGVALAAKRRQKDYKVFVVLGDGECNEGSVWEAAMAASHFRLDNLIAIIDKNNFQQTGPNNTIMSPGDMIGKWRSFGWNSCEVDGHDYDQLTNQLTSITPTGDPSAIIANTIKGKGISFAENNNAWHHAVLTQSQYETAIQEIHDK